MRRDVDRQHVVGNGAKHARKTPAAAADLQNTSVAAVLYERELPLVLSVLEGRCFETPEIAALPDLVEEAACLAVNRLSVAHTTDRPASMGFAVAPGVGFGAEPFIACS